MKTLLEIKNLYAQEQGYEDWNEIRKEFREKAITFTEMTNHENEVIIRAQKAALENAAENAYIHYPESNNLNPCVDETTITNLENLIL